MNCSTELFQDLVQIADSFHSVASGRRWFCMAILGRSGSRSKKGYDMPLSEIGANTNTHVTHPCSTIGSGE